MSTPELGRSTKLQAPEPHMSEPLHPQISHRDALGASNASREQPQARRRVPVNEGETYEAPDQWTNLNEVNAIPVENATDRPVYTHGSLEETRHYEQELRKRERADGRNPDSNQGGLLEEESGAAHNDTKDKPKANTEEVSNAATQLYTLSYLVFFSLLGTLARVGLTALTTFPGTPVMFNTIWANFGGSMIMGFLAEDRMLFRHEWGTPTYDQLIAQAKQQDEDKEGPSASGRSVVNLVAAKKAHLSTKKTIPLYIGLATGFCGSFTSFSTFIRDAFLALSNDMETPGFPGSPKSRNGGYSFMAMLAVIITTVCLSLSALFAGAHLAIASEPFIPSVPYLFTRKILDRIAVVLGWGCWLGAVLLCVFPPHQFWRGRATFSLVFAPIGCLARFYLSLYLNAKVPSFPMGTFAANALGTVVLGMSWDVAHIQSGGVVGCQVLQGVEDGFCGCLTTISTWVAELSTLQRKHAYIYGAVSIVVSLAFMIAVMGGLRWTHGFDALVCLP